MYLLLCHCQGIVTNLPGFSAIFQMAEKNSLVASTNNLFPITVAVVLLQFDHLPLSC